MEAHPELLSFRTQAVIHHTSSPGEPLEHEGQCDFRPYDCPCAGSECSVAGDVPFLVAHLGDEPKVDMQVGSAFNHRYVKSNPREVENATWMLTAQTPVSMAVLRFMGDWNEAMHHGWFPCTALELVQMAGNLHGKGTPLSIRDSQQKVRDMALYFSGGDGKELKLRVTGRIWKEQ
ncbi:E3 ubiquitin-protein ligase [Musa troglodytarum]|uniref:RING-type E3 ubiquitin transferase n=1 Tax=Musa troglodytarum TaxID=320322 RepID=A0A9E7KJ96_9LILI|nr:E3 ubiquitin-protein ligase [Musa troglodytarum]